MESAVADISRRTGSSVRTGTILVYCRRCKVLIEMNVEIVRDRAKARAGDDP